MKRSLKILVSLLLLIIFCIGIFWFTFGSPLVFYHNHILQEKICEITQETVTLNELVPFDWDKVYSFPAYMPKEEIENQIGFRSPSIKENNINEGMVHLIFVKDEHVEASILGYPENLGYAIDFPDCVEYKDNIVFSVEKQNGVVRLLLR